MRDELVTVSLEKSTLATLIAGLYCLYSDIDPIAIPESVYLEIAEKLVYFLISWDYEKITFEDWIKYGLMIYPKEMLSEEDLKYLQENTLYWERINGNVTLIVSMDISDINE